MEKLVQTEIIRWWQDDRTPAPRRGGTYLHCPHATVEIVKVPRKKAKEFIVHCPFKTKNYKKYRRHYLNRHGEYTPEELPEKLV
jgi:hypothetical protein